MNIKFNTCAGMAMLLLSQASFSNNTGQDQTPEDVHWVRCVQAHMAHEKQPERASERHNNSPEMQQLLSQCQPPESTKKWSG